jgi:two-component system nitrogen regulation response regulator GlnG
MAPAQTIEIKDLPPDLVSGSTPEANSEIVAGPAPTQASASASPSPDAERNGSAAFVPAALAGVATGLPVSVWESGLRAEVARMLRENTVDVMDELARRFEAAVIREALDFTRGRKVEAAERLGIGRNTITRKIQELHLES